MASLAEIDVSEPENFLAFFRAQVKIGHCAKRQTQGLAGGRNGVSKERAAKRGTSSQLPSPKRVVKPKTKAKVA